MFLKRGMLCTVPKYRSSYFTHIISPDKRKKKRGKKGTIYCEPILLLLLVSNAAKNNLKIENSQRSKTQQQPASLLYIFKSQ